MKMKLPMRFRILQLICDGSRRSDIIDTIKIKDLIHSEYGNERQCNDKNISTHILALKSVGLIVETKVYMEKNELISEYKATYEGYKRLKLLPSYIVCSG